MTESGNKETNFQKVDSRNIGDIAIQNALKVGLFVLKILLVIAVGSWIFSGFYKVENGEQAVAYFLGKMQPYQDSNVRSENWYWGFPYPFTRVIKLPAKKEISVRINPNLVTGAGGVETTQDPILKGTQEYYLTKDQNIVYLSWDITFRVKKLDQVIQSFYDEENHANDSSGEPHWIINSQNFIILASKGIFLEECLKQNAFDVLTGRNVINQISRQRLQQLLDELQCGLEITSLTLVQTLPPESVRNSFVQVLTAKEKKKEAIAESHRQRQEVFMSIEGEVKSIHLASKNEVDELTQNLKADVARVATIAELYKGNPDGLKAYLKQLYYETVSQALAAKRVEILQRPEKATFQTEIFNPTAEKNPELNR